MHEYSAVLDTSSQILPTTNKPYVRDVEVRRIELRDRSLEEFPFWEL